MVDLLVLLRTGGDVDFIWRNPDHWAVLIMQTFDLEVVPTIEIRLVEFGDSREKRAGYIRQWVVVAAIDAR